MNGTKAVLAVLLVAATVVSAPLTAATVSPLADGGTGGPAAVASDGTATDGENATGGNGTAGNVSPGAHLSGVVSSHDASLNGEVERRALGVRLNRAATAADRVGVVAAEYDTLTERLQGLRDRQAALVAAHENGTLSQGSYHARAASLAAEIRAVERRTDTTVAATDDLSGEALAERGVNRTALGELRAAAGNLTGPEVAAIARGLGGPPEHAGGPPDHAGGPPDHAGGPPGDAPGSPGEGGPPDEGGPPGEGRPPGAAPTDDGNATAVPGDDAAPDSNTTTGAGDTPDGPGDAGPPDQSDRRSGDAPNGTVTVTAADGTAGDEAGEEEPTDRR